MESLKNWRNGSATVLTFFDFDSGGPGWRAYDLTVCRWAVSIHAKSAEPWEAFTRGYQTRRTLQPADLEAVLVFVAWCLQRLQAWEAAELK